MTLKDRLPGIRQQLKNVKPPSLQRLKAFGLTTWLVVGVVCIATIELFTGNAGCIEVHPGEVAVIYNNTGLIIFGDPQKTHVEQGVQSFIPGVHSVEVLERKPQILVMIGEPDAKDAKTDHNRVAALTVRANDGSNFYFDGLEVHYQIIASDAARVIQTSGRGEAYKEHLVQTHVREILRDEFGASGFLEIADPTRYSAATTEAKRRLNERLAPYGVEITQIITPKPKFDPRVEKAIEDRQNAEQDVSVQQEKRNKLEQERQLKIQGVEQSKNQEYQGLVAALESEKKAASNTQLSTKREADKYFIDQEAAGGAYLDEKLTRAKANEIAYRKEAEGLVARITAVGAQGPDVLNNVIAEKVFPQLKKVTATPFVKQSTPIDIRHIQGVAAAPKPKSPAAGAGGEQ